MTNFDSPVSVDTRRIRRVVLQAVLLVVAAVIAAYLLYALWTVILLLILTVMFCYLIAPLVNFLQQPVRIGRFVPRLPHIAAIVLVYLILGSAILFTFDNLIPVLTQQLSSLFDDAPTYVKQLDQQFKWLTSLPTRYRLPQNWRDFINSGLNTALSSVLGWLRGVAFKIIGLTLYLPWLILIPIIGFFLLKDAQVISNKVLASLPKAGVRYRATFFLNDVSQTLAAYIRAQLLACVIVSVIEASGLWLIGLPYPLIFGVGAAILEFVPVVGPLILGVIAIVVGGFYSSKIALLAFIFLVIFRIIQDYVIYPRLISRGIELHPLAVILAVLCGAELGGVTGIFLSVPVAALLIVCWRHWRSMQLNRPAPVAGIQEPKHLEVVKE